MLTPEYIISIQWVTDTSLWGGSNLHALLKLIFIDIGPMNIYEMFSDIIIYSIYIIINIRTRG